MKYGIIVAFFLGSVLAGDVASAAGLQALGAEGLGNAEDGVIAPALGHCCEDPNRNICVTALKNGCPAGTTERIPDVDGNDSGGCPADMKDVKQCVFSTDLELIQARF